MPFDPSNLDPTHEAAASRLVTPDARAAITDLMNAAAEVIDRTLIAYREHVAPDEWQAVEKAQQAGGMMRLQVSLGMSGTQHLRVALVLPLGQEVELATLDLSVQLPDGRTLAQ